MITWLYFLIILLISGSGVADNQSNETDAPPNFVWITSEDNSKHYLQIFDPHGVETPNIAKLAQRGLIFRHAFSNAPVCSVARSTLISGCYGPRIGAQFHRKLKMVAMPDSLLMFPEYLREAGYYTTNNSKEDYNIHKTANVWDESSRKASWKNRKINQPFFHVQNFTTTHESKLHFTKSDMENQATKNLPEKVLVFPNHPQTDLFRYTNAYYRDRIEEMDEQVGMLINQLEEEDLLSNTFVFYFADHGGVLPGSKGYLYETGLHVPLIIHVPEQYQYLIEDFTPGDVDGFVSFVDFAPTMLNLAGVDVPEAFDGRAFLGPGVSLKELNSRNTTYSYADRFDEKYDLVRAVRKGRFKYIRNFQPFTVDGLMNNYRYKQLAYQEWLSLFRTSKLSEEQTLFFNPRLPEALYDLERDPYEIHNLATSGEMKAVLDEMRVMLSDWMNSMPDLSMFPEHVLIQRAFSDPVEFGQEYRDEISRYIEIANLATQPFSIVKDALSEALRSSDSWQRYWAIIVCSSFGKQSQTLIGELEHLLKNDSESINRTRAAEYLGLTDVQDPSEMLIAQLYGSSDAAEALLILNTIVLMKDHKGHRFNLEPDRIDAAVAANVEVSRRLKYLVPN